MHSARSEGSTRLSDSFSPFFLSTVFVLIFSFPFQRFAAYEQGAQDPVHRQQQRSRRSASHFSGTMETLGRDDIER